MTRQYFKRSCAMLLAILMMLAAVPIMAIPVAATTGTLSLDDTNIGLKYTTDNVTAISNTYGTWSASGTTIDGNAKGGSFGSKSGSLTITNNYSTKMRISFLYTCTVTSSSTTITIDGSAVTESGSFSKDVDAGGTIKIEISAAKKEVGTINITDFQALDPDKKVTLTFQTPENGSYTVNGTTISTETSITNPATDLWTLKATPASGYKFMCWYDVTDGKVLSTDSEYSCHFSTNCTIVAKFVSTAAAVFMVEDQMFGDLGDAVTYAQNNSKTLIKLASNGTVTGQYTIPAGITLLIPFDDEYTLYTTEPDWTEESDTTPPVAYKTMTMVTGSSLTVNGATSVGGKHYTSSSQVVCKPTGPYGHIKMEAGSSIVLNNGANLYAWGYITGDGNITANSGANVYEYFQIVDWRGGGKTSEMAGNKNKVFPFTQYYVQNIEAALTLKQGANEYVYMTATVSKQHASATVNFIGDKGLFALGSDGSITKKYDASQSKLRIDISGTASLNSIALSMTIMFQTIDVDSSDYVLPINGNIDITVKSGTTTITKDVALLPGVVATIDEGAELKVASGATLYTYEAGTWATNYTWGTNALPYSPTNSNRINYTIKGVSAKLDINGTLTADGDVYTTACEDENKNIIAGNICSSKGTGKFVKNAATEVEGVTYQAIQISNDLTYEEIPVLCAWLLNADGSYTDTSEAEAGTTFYYVEGVWTTQKPAEKVTITWVVDGKITTTDVDYGTTPSYDGTPTKAADAQYTYEFSGWDKTLANATEPATYTAQFTSSLRKYTITFVNYDGSVLYSEDVEYGNTPEYKGETPTKPAEGHYTYSFSGWSPEVGMVTGNKTYTAQFAAILKTYNVYFNANGGEGSMDSLTVNAGNSAELAANSFTNYGHKFIGWNTQADGKGDSYNNEGTIYNLDSDITLYAQWEKIVITVVWLDNNNDQLYTKNYEYGQEYKPEDYIGDTPTLDSGSPYDFYYEFAGWEYLEAQSYDTYVVYRAKFEVKYYEYIITFDANGGTGTMALQTVRYGINNLSGNNFYRDHYTFSGWNTEADGSGNSYDNGASINVTDHITLYAQWAGNACSVVLDVSGHGGINDRTDVSTYGSYYILPTLEDEHYDFKGWRTVVNGSEKIYAGGDSLKIEKESYYFYALWEAKTYIITLDLNGGACDRTSLECTYGAAQDLPTPTWEHHTFRGWYPTSDFSGDTSYDRTILVEGSVTLYAKWEADPCYIIWKNYNGDVLYEGLYDYDTDASKYPYEDLTIPGDKYSSHKFSHWEKMDTEESSADDTIIYIARFDTSIFIYFDANGGTGTMEMVTLKYNDSYSAPENPFTRDHYEFIGWSFDAKGTGDRISEYKNLGCITAGFTLYAQWQGEKYDVSWKNHDNSDLDSKSYRYGDNPIVADDYPGATPTKPSDDHYSYEFTGWVKDEEKSTERSIVYVAQYKPLREGWHTDDNGKKSYYEKDEIKYKDKSTWVEIDGAYYFFESGYVVTGYHRIPYPTELLEKYAPDEEDSRVNKIGQPGYQESIGEYPDDTSAIFFFDEDGKLRTDYCGIYDDNGVTRWVQNGMVIWHAGLVKDSDGNYFYFKRTGQFMNGNCYVADTNGLLKAANYFFDGGYLKQLNGIHEDPTNNGVYRYYENFTPVYFKGLFTDDYGFSYYVNEAGEVVRNGVYLVKKVNGVELDQSEWSWRSFDEYGRLETAKNGLTEENGELYYYNEGTRTYAGLVNVNGNYYYINDSLKAVKDGVYWVTKVNDTGLKAGLQRTFDAEGKMVVKSGLALYDEAKNIWVYYENDDIVMASEGEKIYINLTDGRKVRIDEYGVATVLSTEDGLVFESNGDICYYENGEKVYNKGLVRDKDGNYYYINWTGKAVKDTTCWVTLTNGLVKSGLQRTFGADGKMVVKSGLMPYNNTTVYYENDDIVFAPTGSTIEKTLGDGTVIIIDADGVAKAKVFVDKNGLVHEDNGDICYYENGELVFKGLIKDDDGNYYYINWNGKAVKDTTCWVTKTNGLVKSGLQRTFDENGKMVVRNGIVRFDDANNIDVYYENDDIVMAPAGEKVERTLDDGSKINIDEYGVVRYN